MKILTQTQFGNHKLIGDLLSSNTPAELLVLHGAGQGRRSRFELLREELLRREIGTAAFDGVGHGDTGGTFEGVTLRSRTEQAKKFVRSLDEFSFKHVFGSSMGAYTAIKLTSDFPIETLILNVPAVYDLAAYDVLFGPDFSSIIRAENSWERSDAWHLLSSFTGKLLVISAGMDEVIPQAVIEKILQSASSAKSVEHLEVKESGHLLSQYMNENPDILLEVASKIEWVIKS